MLVKFHVVETVHGPALALERTQITRGCSTKAEAKAVIAEVKADLARIEAELSAMLADI